MRSFLALAAGTALACSGAAAHKQRPPPQPVVIQDLWFASPSATNATTAGGLNYTALNPPISFVDKHAKLNHTQVTIKIKDHKVYQQMRGFGGSLTDASASTLAKLKKSDEKAYDALLKKLFDPADGEHESAALSFLRIPIGATDFSTKLYSYADKEGDKDLKEFKIDNADLFAVVGDILKIHPNMTIQALPWSPPHWMKKNDAAQIKSQLANNTYARMMGGTFDEQYTDVYATYLLKTVQEFQKKGVNVTFLGLQNEPLNQDFTYPSCMMAPSTMAKLGGKVRELLDKNGLAHTQLSGYEHNWGKLERYAGALKSAKDVFGAYGAHCYGGSVKDQRGLHKQQPGKEILVSECSGTIGADFWGELEWQAEHISLGAVNRFATVGAMWNLALDPAGAPKLPGARSCRKGCRGIVTVDDKQKVTLNQEFFALGMVSKAVAPKDAGAPAAHRVKAKVHTHGHQRYTQVHDPRDELTVSAFVAPRADDKEPERVSLVVLNKSGAKKKHHLQVQHKARSISATIKFRHLKAEYTFPPGLTTLAFYAEKPQDGKKKDGHRFHGL